MEFKLKMNHNKIGNDTFSLNTTDSNIDCKPECYLNCQVHFPDPLEQKFCLLNVCHCQIIEKRISLLDVQNDNGSKEYKNNLDGSSQNVVQKEKEDRNKFNILLIILLLLFIPSMIYYSFQMYKYFDLAHKQYDNLQSNINNHYSLVQDE